MKNANIGAGLVALLAASVGCGGGSDAQPDARPADAAALSGPDTAAAPDARPADTAVPSGTDAAAAPDASPAARDGAAAAPAAACTGKPVVDVQDLSGTWVLRTVGAQLISAPTFSQPFHVKSVNVSLFKVTQTGNGVVLDGRTCDRTQQDDPLNPAKVVIPDKLRLTEREVHRIGSYAADATGARILSLPTFVDVVGARLANPTTDNLPTDAADSRVVDDDNDGHPGISINMTGLISGTVYSVQRESTTLTGVPVGAERVEGGMGYASDQTLLETVPATIKTLYSAAKATTDPAPCSSTFAMVKVADSADCAWVRANQATLFGP